MTTEEMVARRDHLRRNLPIWQALGQERYDAGETAGWKEKVENWRVLEREYRLLVIQLAERGYYEPEELQETLEE